jgi:hypothetical protein
MMTIDPALKILLEELGQCLSLGEVALDAEGGCALRFGEKATVNLQYRPAEEEFYFYSDLGAPPASVALYQDLLAANLFWQGTAGATLSLSDDDPAHVVIAQAFGWRGRTGAELARAIDAFANMAQDWSEILAGETGASEAPRRDFETMLRV